ncbi:MAG: hypothetical protein LAP85_10880 [Acidobacteriia bacterium]|nr:hypothetical protein [Terriglobia bacterium]
MGWLNSLPRTSCLVCFAVIAANSDTMTFALPDRGGFTRTTQGDSSSTLSGYANIQPNIGSTTPSGVAIFGLRQANALVSETGVPATAALTAGRIYAEIGGGVDAGLAIVNPNDSTATINFYFTDANGFPAGSRKVKR